jgi:hypothetical protein
MTLLTINIAQTINRSIISGKTYNRESFSQQSFFPPGNNPTGHNLQNQFTL